MLWWFVCFLSPSSVILCSGQQDHQDRPHVVSQAVEYARDSLSEEISDSDSTGLYKVAQHWYNKATATTTNDNVGDAKNFASVALQLFHYLADEQHHVLSMAKLGHYYAGADDIPRALHYYTNAGESGPHQASLYNAGRLLVDRQDWVGAMAYLRAAATLGTSHPQYAKEATTQVAIEAFEILSSQLSRTELTVMQVADLFMYGSLEEDNLTEKAERKWRESVMSLMQFNETFVSTAGQQDPKVIETAVNAMHELYYEYQKDLSPLQTHLLLDNLNDMLGLAAGLDDKHVPLAAQYAEALASSPLCFQYYATSEEEGACFNGAAASAMSYYRRMANAPASKRVLHLAQSHPHAATHWKRVEQTPRVFHPELQAKAWWNQDDFSASRALRQAYQKYSTQILDELQQVKKLQEGKLRGTVAGDDEGQQTTVQIDASGNQQNVNRQQDDDNDFQSGLQRIFTPYIGVRTEKEETRQEGAGGWAEFGPLFDGIHWDENNCQIVPTICQALKDDPSLCTAVWDNQQESINKTMVSKLCGADTVVTILRLRPGTTILPHCGTTNARLILHFALEGANGIEFSVGDEVVKSYGGGDGKNFI